MAWTKTPTPNTHKHTQIEFIVVKHTKNKFHSEFLFIQENYLKKIQVKEKQDRKSIDDCSVSNF
jgi:hypothetical protein